MKTFSRENPRYMRQIEKKTYPRHITLAASINQFPKINTMIKNK